MGLGVGEAVLNEQNLNPEKLREWLDGIPEIAKQREPANVLALVFFVEVLKEKEKGGGSGSNA